jgi:hypothetical protein
MTSEVLYKKISFNLIDEKDKAIWQELTRLADLKGGRKISSTLFEILELGLLAHKVGFTVAGAALKIAPL